MRYSPPDTLEDLKALLFAYPDMLDRVKELRLKVIQTQEEADADLEISSLVNDGTPRGSDVSDPTARKAIIAERHYAHISKLIENIDLITEIRYNVHDAMEQLTTDERDIIKARYFTQLSWRGVARAVHICRNNCVSLHDLALETILSIMKGDKHNE